MSEGVASWWLMSWGTAQAGDRASQTGHYGQWWDRDAEQLVETSGRYNLHHSSFLLLQRHKNPAGKAEAMGQAYV